mgnify:CR=1 FL=1
MVGWEGGGAMAEEGGGCQSQCQNQRYKQTSMPIRILAVDVTCTQGGGEGAREAAVT